MPLQRQTISQTTIHDRDITNAPLLPRVVTPLMSRPAPLRVPMRSQNISPQNMSQDEFCGMDTAHMAITPRNRHWSQKHQAHAVVHPITAKKKGIHDRYEIPSPATTLETRFWQRSRTPFSRHSRHSWNQHMFLYQTYKHPKGQTYHLRKNGL
jgi:hypothetical protein